MEKDMSNEQKCELPPKDDTALERRDTRVRTYLPEEKSLRDIADHAIPLTRDIHRVCQAYIELYDACKELLDAPHYDHFVVRLNDHEMEAFRKIQEHVNEHR